MQIEIKSRMINLNSSIATTKKNTITEPGRCIFVRVIKNIIIIRALNNLCLKLLVKCNYKLHRGSLFKNMSNKYFNLIQNKNSLRNE